MVSIRQAVAADRPRTARLDCSRTGLKRRIAPWAPCAAALAALGFTGFAIAKSSNAPGSASSTAAGSQQAATLQEVTVTGSRIKRTTDFTTSTPTTVIDSQTMQSMGIVNVGQALKMTPANVSAFTPQSTGGSAFYTGAYIPDLRGLNGFFNTRTLTLIDGKRAVPTNTSDSFDLNFVPQILVQRIETVTGGASAAYGSGAVAGVINIILNRDLNGGKLDVDEYDTHYNDARDRHAAFAYGHGLFNDRFHFVIGGEWEKQDPARCMQSGRPWCVRNYGAYPTAYGPTGTAQTTLGADLRTDVVSTSGAFAPALFSFAPFGYTHTAPGAALYQATPSGLGYIPYYGNSAAMGGNTIAPGGQGEPVNQYINLLTPVTRGVITAMLTTKLTNGIKMDVDFNWGKVEAANPNSGNNTQYGLLGYDNPYLPGASSGSPVLTAATAPDGIYLGKDWNQQIPNEEFSNTTLKRVVVDFNGPIGDSSWTWDGYYEYGLTENTEGEPTDFHADEAGMALDAIKNPTTGQPECRITQALADHPGNPQAAFADALGQAATAYPNPYGFAGVYGYPSYLESIQLSGVLYGVPVPADPLTGLGLLQQEALLAQGCLPLNPFGKAQLRPALIHYVTGPLSLKLRQTQTVIAVNATGNFWHGIGAGPFSIAAGYEWRQQVVHNNFAQCPPGTMSAAAYTLCLAQTTDFTVQFGDPYGGDMDVNEGYLELNFPLLKDRPFARNLDLDVAGRVSAYDNTALYAVGIPSGASGTSTFPTWKVSLNYTPVRGVRFRATESRDERAPDPRDLYYSQIFVAGSLFGSCAASDNASITAPCNINLIGNVNLKPETAKTTTFGIVLTPAQIPGLEFSADWFHIHLVNGINGGNYGTIETQCATGHGAAACNGITFNPYSYNAAGQACASGGSGSPYPGAGGVACTGSAVSGAEAFQQGNVANIADVNAPAYNGAFYNERGIDFSLNYVWALPDGSTVLLRALTTWVGEQGYQNYAGGPIYDLLGQTGNNSSLFGLGDYQNAPRWRGNISVTWTEGPWSITPNVTWIGQGTLNNQGLACSEKQLTIASNPCSWVYNGFPDAGKNLPDSAAQTYLKNENVTLLPIGVANYVPAYFLVGLNATYSFRNVLKGLQLYTQINNLLNKAPPFTQNATASAVTGVTTNPVFYDQLGLAYRVGFRLRF